MNDRRLGRSAVHVTANNVLVSELDVVQLKYSIPLPVTILRGIVNVLVTAMPSSANDMAQLPELPAELYDQIYGYIFTAKDRIQTTEIADEFGYPLDNVYRPPSVLGVSRAWRARFARSYYNEMSFKATSLPACVEWLQSLPTQHARLLRDVTIEYFKPHSSKSEAAFYSNTEYVDDNQGRCQFLYDIAEEIADELRNALDKLIDAGELMIRKDLVKIEVVACGFAGQESSAFA